jgi:hypothetical protein
MKWSVEYGEKMYGEIKPSAKKQVDSARTKTAFFEFP